jgi:hypothetical protein
MGFCTDCGQAAPADAKFCEHCGHSFPAEAEPPIDQARKWISSWVMPFNASLLFGTTMVGVLDFVSPRIALLPSAAAVVLACLLALVGLRRFVAPNLPNANPLRLLLTPNLALHRSPLLVGTGVLSLLMVSGAAWSHATAAKGGVVASHFDAARNAQMQLGLLQGVQKEQRVQTAVLEDIREGRTSNPRRELANQGILWTTSDRANAVESGDTAVVSLFLAGGMPWSQRTIKRPLESGNQTMVQVFLEYPQLLQSEDACMESIRSMQVGPVSTLRKQLTYRPQKVPALTAVDLRLLQLFCNKPGDVASLQERLQSDKETYQSQLNKHANGSIAIRTAPGTLRTSAECQRDLTAANGQRVLRLAHSYESLGNQQGCGPLPCFDYATAGSEALMFKLKNSSLPGAGGLSGQNLADIKAYCEVANYQVPVFDDFEIQWQEQVLQALH